VILELHRKGHDQVKAVDLPLTSLADDAERTRRMIRQIDGPVVLVGHSYGGAVITEAGNQPNVQALVHIAAFAPDSGESPGGITQQHLPEAAPSLAPDSDGHLWLPSQDRMISPQNQKAMAERMQTKRLLQLEASHASLASHPADVAALILEAVAAVDG